MRRWRPAPRLDLALLCALLGILVVSQFRVQERIAADLRAQSGQNQLTLMANLIDGNARLRDEVGRLAEEARRLDAAEPDDIEALRREIAHLEVVNGLAPVGGPGLQLSLDAPLEVYWLQDVLNELRNAGAEGIGINGRRLLATSVLLGTARQLELDGSPLDRPYLIEAIGDPEALYTALNRPGGLILQLRAQYGPAAARLSRQPLLTLPAHPHGPILRLGQPPPSP